MPVDAATAEKVLEQIRPDEVAALGRDLANIPSPTGHERELADFILAWYKANGIKPVRQEVEPGRPNAVGILKGKGRGLSLIINGHMDTSYTGTEEDLRLTADIESGMTPPPAEVRDGKVYGLGISNMKGGVASFMAAAKAIHDAGVELKGDLVLAAVVGEISRTPVDQYQGSEYRGEGIGTRHLLSHGIQSDYAIVADGSHLNIVWAQNGVVDAKITVYGTAGSAWSFDRKSHPPLEKNAVVKATRVVQAIEEWGARFEEDNVYQAPTGPLYPRVNIGAIEGGGPYRPNYQPGVCSVYVDVRIPPQVSPVSVKHQLQDVMDGLGIEYDLDVYRTLRGYEGKNVEPLVESIDDVYQYLFKAKVEPERPRRASIWTDTNIFNEMGIPTVKIGPRGSSVSTWVEEIEIDMMVRAVKLYALTALDICNRER